MKKQDTSKTLQDKVKHIFLNNYLVISVWMLVVFISSTFTLIQGYNTFVGFYHNTFGYKAYLYNEINHFYTNVDIDYFYNLIGKPTIIDNDTENKQKEYIFINNHFYLEVTTDLDNKVLAYAVTSREKDFQPTYTPPAYGNEGIKKIVLNKTTFADLSNSIVKDDWNSSDYPPCFYSSGVRRFSYFEGHYDGNPGHYQSYYFGVNDAGYVDTSIKIPDSMFNLYPEKDDFDCVKIPQDFRNQNTVNTFVVTAPFYEFATSSSKLKFGVDLDEVRVLN